MGQPIDRVDAPKYKIYLEWHGMYDCSEENIERMDRMGSLKFRWSKKEVEQSISCLPYY